MKQAFANAWKSSKNRRKQRKYIANAPLHIRGRFLHTHLAKELMKKFGLRSIRARKGDKVKIMVGQYKGKTGTVESVDIDNTKLLIDTASSTKRDGSKAYYPIHPSNVQIQELSLDDARRQKHMKKTDGKQ